MDCLMKQLYTFVLPHLNQQNINEGMELLFKISQQMNKLDANIQILNTRNSHLNDENKFYKSQIVEHINKLNTELSKLDNTNITNLLQMTKYQLEELKSTRNVDPTSLVPMEKSN